MNTAMNHPSPSAAAQARPMIMASASLARIQPGFGEDGFPAAERPLQDGTPPGLAGQEAGWSAGGVTGLKSSKLSDVLAELEGRIPATRSLRSGRRQPKVMRCEGA